MGWFQDQIEQRMKKDDEVLEESFLSMAHVVMGKWAQDQMLDERATARQALGEILKYYHLTTVQIPEDQSDPAEQVDTVMRLSGYMTRTVNLEEGWQKHAWGPMLGCLKDQKVMVALIPGMLGGYHYSDPVTGKRVRVTRKTAAGLAPEALCFYQPLPRKKLGIPDLIWHMRKCISTGDVVFIVLATLALTLIGKLEPRAYNALTGPILESRQIQLLSGMIAFLLGVAVASALMTMIKNLLLQRIQLKTSQAVEASVMMRILSLPVSFFRNYSSGELASRASSIHSLCENMLNMIFSLGLGSLMSLLYITDILRYAPALVVPSILLVFATMLLSIVAALMRTKITERSMKYAAEENGMTYAMLNGIQKIRLSGSEKRAFARWGKLYAREAELEYNPPMFLKLSNVIVTAVSLLGTVILYSIALNSGVAVSEYYAFSAAFGRLQAAFTALAGIATTAAAIRPVLKMAEPILQAEPEVTEDKKQADRVTGDITLNHVWFRYDEQSPYVLQDLSLHLKPGEYVAVVGRTGCGKSTLIRLLLGFEKPEKGTVFYDNRDLATLDPRSVRKQIGVVIQNGELFTGDIFANIAIAAPDLTLEGAWEAAEIAGIAGDIREMPMGMQTVISEGQGGISGGQKQRLMIARAVAPKPRILILDEATSALDNKTQRQVTDALDRLNCTRLIVAHRLSTIQHCDRILVLDGGHIIEEGTYEELIAQNGYFADLVARQRLDLDT